MGGDSVHCRLRAKPRLRPIRPVLDATKQGRDGCPPRVVTWTARSCVGLRCVSDVFPLTASPSDRPQRVLKPLLVIVA